MWFIIFWIIVLIWVICLLSMWPAWIVVALIISFILVSLSVRIVTPNTVKAVEFLWRFTRVLKPGLNFLIPILEQTRHQDLFRKNISIDVDGITSDNVTVYIGLNVIFYVKDDGDYTINWSIYKSLYTINDPRTMMWATIDEQLRAMVSEFDHKIIFGKREEIWETIEQQLRTKLSEFGYVLDSIQVRNIKLEGSVMAAMNKVVETQKLKEAAINEWEARKILQIKEAEADKEAKILLGQWMAGQRMEIAKWFKESVDMIMSSDSTLNWEKILKFLLDSSRIETLWAIWSTDKTKLIYLNEDLEGRSAATKSWKLIAGSDLVG